jgi:uncharacterized membrane protein YgcG
MYQATHITLSLYTWAQWKRDAVAARTRAKRAAWFAFSVVTIAAALVGVANVEGTWRYSVIVYAPVAGLVVFEPVSRVAMRSVFRTTGAAMRYRLVPSLVAQATDAQLAELAATNFVNVGKRSLQAVDTGKEVIVSAGPAWGYAGGEVSIIDDAGAGGGDGGGGFGGGDGGGGFGGGGDGGGGGG